MSLKFASVKILEEVKQLAQKLFPNNRVELIEDKHSSRVVIIGDCAAFAVSLADYENYRWRKEQEISNSAATFFCCRLEGLFVDDETSRNKYLKLNSNTFKNDISIFQIKESEVRGDLVIFSLSGVEAYLKENSFYLKGGVIPPFPTAFICRV